MLKLESKSNSLGKREADIALITFRAKQKDKEKVRMSTTATPIKPTINNNNMNKFLIPSKELNKSLDKAVDNSNKFGSIANLKAKYNSTPLADNREIKDKHIMKSMPKTVNIKLLKKTFSCKDFNEENKANNLNLNTNRRSISTPVVPTNSKLASTTSQTTSNNSINLLASNTLNRIYSTDIQRLNTNIDSLDRLDDSIMSIRFDSLLLQAFQTENLETIDFLIYKSQFDCVNFKFKVWDLPFVNFTLNRYISSPATISSGTNTDIRLINTKADENRGDIPMTLLARSCYLGQLSKVNLLLSRGAKLDLYNFLAFKCAIINRQYEVVSYLLQTGYKFNYFNTHIHNNSVNSDRDEEFDPLGLALKLDDCKMVKILLSYSKCFIDSDTDINFSTGRNVEGNQENESLIDLVLKAIQLNNLKLLKILLNSLSLQQKQQNYVQFLQLSVNEKNWDFAQYLLDQIKLINI